jgi:hypothetical protein
VVVAVELVSHVLCGIGPHDCHDCFHGAGAAHADQGEQIPFFFVVFFNLFFRS